MPIPVSLGLLQQFDVAGPRYTSYPTADRFVEAFGEVEYQRTLVQRFTEEGARPQPLSMYVHIPFCASLCYYCACNKVITKHHSRSAEYLRYLAIELALHTNLIGKGRVVSQLHLGGGSPTFLNDQELQALLVSPCRCYRLQHRMYRVSYTLFNIS